MAAGLGFKDFTTGEVLTAADVDGYLMQGIWVFASAAARDAAVTSPQEGNFAFLKDTNTTTYYTGSAWTNLDTTGMVNPMTTTGDTIYSSSGSTPARLGIGTAGQVLTVNSGATAPEWATPASGTFVGCTLSSTAGQSISNSTETAVTFSSEDIDTDGFHSTVTNTDRITIPAGKGGKYLIYGQVRYDTGSTGRRIAYLRLNNTTYMAVGEATPGASTKIAVNASVIYSLSVGDFINLATFQSQGTTQSLLTEQGSVLFGAVYLGA